MMIPLTRGYVAEIDFSDWWKVQGRNWFAVERGNTMYAETRVAGRNIGMHTFIRQAPEGYHIDHKDRNGLNNRWNNLRPATHRQNMLNAVRTQQSEYASGYRGVTLLYSGRYQARIRHEGKNHGLGTFDTAEEAAHAYDDAAKEWHGEFAILNFSQE